MTLVLISVHPRGEPSPRGGLIQWVIRWVILLM